jgi:fructokinase
MHIGIDLGGTKIEIVALEPGGRVRVRRRVATPQDDYAATVQALGALVREVETELDLRATVGIGTPGAISPATGRMKNCNSTWLNGQPLLQDLESALERRVRLANDADCFTLSEAIDGAGRGASVVFGVIVGTGTGGGITVDGRLLGGPNAIAGEWGHNALPRPRDEERPGPACYCGRRGCIETFLSGPGMARDHREITGETLDPPEIARRAAGGWLAAQTTLERYADRMARSLAGVINLLDPDVIVLGGGMSNLEMLYDTVPRRWGRYVFSDRVDTPLRKPAHGDSSGVLGAARLWMPVP